MDADTVGFQEQEAHLVAAAVAVPLGGPSSIERTLEAWSGVYRACTHPQNLEPQDVLQ